MADCTMDAGNELTELYDSLSVLYDSLPSATDSERKLALKSVLYGDDLLTGEASCYGKQQKEEIGENGRSTCGGMGMGGE